MKILIATSTRADWGLLAPIAVGLRDAGEDVKILATNMHLMQRYGLTVNEIEADGFTIDARVELVDGDNDGDKAQAMADCLAGTARAIALIRPDKIVVLGDRYEMLAVASAASIMRIPIVHIAGGETTLGAIDDDFRNAITMLASTHLTATDDYRQKVISMGVAPESVFNTGAIGVWNAMHRKLLTYNDLCDSLGWRFIPGKTFLVTLHPQTVNLLDDAQKDADRAQRLVEALDRFPEYQVLMTYPNNDPGSAEIISVIERYAAENPDRVYLTKSLGAERYLSALQFVTAVIGNSSSGIVEVPSMGIPTVNIGDRQKGRIAAPSVINCSFEDIAEAISTAVSHEMQQLASRKQNPYYKANTRQQMVDIIRNHFESKAVVCDFVANSLIIIPARGGSKGIPRKNIRELMGRPLIAYTIDVARAIADDRHIILSSDDEEIRFVARRLGLPVRYERPPEFATDRAGSREVILDAMDWADRQGVEYNCVVLLQPTSPLRTAPDVAEAISAYTPDCDMVVSVTDARTNPYYNCYEVTDGTLKPAFPGGRRFTRRQDAPKLYEYNGAVYVINPESIREMAMGNFRCCKPYFMPAERSIDIDTFDDWVLAEYHLDKTQNE